MMDFTREESKKIGEKNLILLEQINDDQIKIKVKEMVKTMVNHECFNNKNYEWSLEDFVIDKFLGRGKFGRVFSAYEKKTGFICALKILNKQELTKHKCELLTVREIEIQTRLKHPNILNLYQWFHDENYIYLVLDYAMEGELYNHLKKDKRFSEKKAAYYIYQVANALQYCHMNRVIHRDLKPENLLLTTNHQIKLADFGWSIHAPKKQRKTMCGTLDYLPPEIVVRQKYDKEVDNWCLGVLCYEFLVGRPPFESETSESTYKKITGVELSFPGYISDGAKDLITNLLQKNPTLRLSLINVMKHPWVLEGKNYYETKLRK